MTVIRPSRMLIGVTGQIGAGKTTAARMLAGFGGAVVDADGIGREVVESNPKLLRKLAAVFGSDILTPSGRLRRSKLAQRAFADRAGRATLNKLVHPHLLKELRRRLTRLLRSYDVVFVDAALLLDWDLDREVDLVLVIHAGQQVRFSRLGERGISYADALVRQRAQLPFSEYRRRADRIILNNDDKNVLKRKLKEWWDRKIQPQIN